MRTRVLVPVLAILLVSVVGSASAQNISEGFRGIKWGADLMDVPDMVPVPGQDGKERFYTRKDDPLRADTAKLKSITYGFYDGKFYSVVFTFTSSTNFELLREQLEKELGTAKGSGSQYEWNKPTLKAFLSYDARKDSGSLSYYYLPVAQQKVVDKRIENVIKRPRHY